MHGDAENRCPIAINSTPYLSLPIISTIASYIASLS